LIKIYVKPTESFREGPLLLLPQRTHYVN